MFLGLQWYWLLVIAVALVILIPVKIKFIQWWSKRQREKNQHGKWGGQE